MSFDALKVVHRVIPVQTGARYSITLYTWQVGSLDSPGLGQFSKMRFSDLFV